MSDFYSNLFLKKIDECGTKLAENCPFELSQDETLAQLDPINDNSCVSIFYAPVILSIYLFILALVIVIVIFNDMIS